MMSVDPIDLMRSFWLADPGADARGPFTLDEVGRMFRSGALYPTSMVCEVGTESWQPVTVLRREFPSVFAAGPVQRASIVIQTPSASRNTGTYRLLALLLGGIGAHNFYAGEVIAGVIKLALLFTGVGVRSIGELGAFLSGSILFVVFALVTVELVTGHGIGRAPR